jgi:hypothetical protein
VSEPTHPQLVLLLSMLDEAYDHNAWHGPNLKNCFHRVTVKDALWRHTPDGCNLWELLLHCAYWKYVVWRKVAGDVKRGFFPRKGSDFFSRTEGTASEWKADLALLDEIHANLRSAVAALDPAKLHQIAGKSDTLAFFIRGAALHDTYHTGQAQTIKQALLRSKKP